MKAVIMAGGQGTRLRPLTCGLPKPMVPILNRPVMEHIIGLLKRQGITDIAVTTCYLPEVIENYFGTGEAWGVELKYFCEETPLGTAGSVQNAADFLNETFLVISGDAVTDFQVEKAVDFHRRQGASGTLVLSREEVPLEYGVVMTDEGGEVYRFLEKPGWGQVFADTVNTGIYVLEPEVFDLYPCGEKFDFSRDLFPLMLKKDMDLYGLPLDGYWNDIGSLKEYHTTQMDYLRGRIELPLEAEKLSDNIWIEEGVNIIDSSRLEGPLYIGSGSFVGEGVYLSHSVIGRGNRLEKGSSLKRSICWNNCFVGPGCELRGTVLADGVSLKKGVKVYDSTVLGRKVEVKERSTITPEVKIWPEKEVRKETRVNENIIWPTSCSQQLFSRTGVAGVSNVDITPEFVSRLAAAYGTTLRKGDKVALGSDSYKMSGLLKRVFSGGLQAAGVDVIDLGNTVTPVVRYATASLDVVGGIHVRLSGREPGKSVLEFLNERGAGLSSVEQREVEKKFSAADFSRVREEEIGNFSFAPGMSGAYVDDLLDGLESEKIRGHNFNLILDYEYDNLQNILPRFLRELNCRMVSTRNYSHEERPLSLGKRLEARNRVGRIIQENEADLGFILTHNGRRLFPVSRSGELLGEQELQVLISYLLLERGYKELFLPLNAPRVIKKLAENYGATVEYTPVRPQVAMNKHLQVGEDSRLFYPYEDGIYVLGLILEKMAMGNLSFTELINRVPDFFLNSASVSCDWKDKGRVMRSLSKKAGKNTDLIDGIKFNHREGWALIIPDSEEPRFHIYAEGEDQETAESLTGFYLNKVKEIIEK
ncbi:MAG: sugar phosphate nucleotidyltransferase [Halanaerobiaceae bacterium]